MKLSRIERKLLGRPTLHPCGESAQLFGSQFGLSSKADPSWNIQERGPLLCARECQTCPCGPHTRRYREELAGSRGCRVTGEAKYWVHQKPPRDASLPISKSQSLGQTRRIQNCLVSKPPSVFSSSRMVGVAHNKQSDMITPPPQ